MITEIATRTTENSASTENSKNVEREVTWWLIVGQITVKRKTMTSTASLWEPHYVDKSKKTKKKKILKNGWETEVCHCK